MPDDDRPAMLLVDDDDMFRDSLGAAFHRAGWLVATAATYDEAAEAITGGLVPFRLVLSDYDLGYPRHLTGVDVLALARDQQPDARRALMSGLHREGIPEVEQFRKDNLRTMLDALTTGPARG